MPQPQLAKGPDTLLYKNGLSGERAPDAVCFAVSGDGVVFAQKGVKHNVMMGQDDVAEGLLRPVPRIDEPLSDQQLLNLFDFDPEAPEPNPATPKGKLDYKSWSRNGPLYRAAKESGFSRRDYARSLGEHGALQPTERYVGSKVRVLCLPYTLFGREGDMPEGRVIALWDTPPEVPWPPLLQAYLNHAGHVPGKSDHVHLEANRLMTSLGEFWGKNSNVVSQVADSGERNSEYMKAIRAYHVATGPEKDALAKRWGFGRAGVTGGPAQGAEAWRQAGRDAGDPYLLKYGESSGGGTFRDYVS